MTTAEVRVPRTDARPAAWPWLLLAVLLVADLLLVMASVDAQRAGWAGGRHREWLLRAEGGWAEHVAHAKQFTAAAVLLTLWRRTGDGVFAAWAGVFGCALVDDSLQVHERAGGWLARSGALPEGFAGLRAQDLGELAVWGLVAVVPLAAVVVLHRRADPAVRRAGRGLAAVVAGYAFFGVVVDQVHVLTLGGPLERTLGTVEDGGELVLLSVAVGYVVALLASARASASASSSPA